MPSFSQGFVNPCLSPSLTCWMLKHFQFVCPVHTATAKHEKKNTREPEFSFFFYKNPVAELNICRRPRTAQTIEGNIVISFSVVVVDVAVIVENN